MWLNWIFTVLLIITAVQGFGKCPKECLCNLDDRGRFQTVCNRGGMQSIPVEQMDPNSEVLIIRGPHNHLTIGPVFTNKVDHLEIIRITDSNVPSVGTFSFWGLTKLRILDLSRNNITSLTKDNFKGQEHLDEMDLSHNKINRLTSWVFGHLQDLRRLSSANNLIEKLASRDFLGLAKLKYLDLNENPLTELPPDVFNDITSDHFCENDFRDAKRLTKLRLDRNQLSVIVNNLFPSQRSLEYLDLSHNRIGKIHVNAFVQMANLTTLDLSYNRLVKLLPDTVDSLRKLKALNISGKTQIDLYDIRHTFNILRNLSTLAVADMGQMPQDMLHSFDQLKVLNLSGNHLPNTSLDLLDSIGSLEVLDLSRNRITGVDEKRANQLQQIRDVKLENNPIICDICHMGMLVDGARTLHWNIYPTCHLPERFLGKPISDLNITELDACIEFDEDRYDVAGISENILRNTIQANMNLFVIMCSIAFISITIIILIIALSTKRHSAKYYTNEDRNDGIYEKNFDSLSITGNEMNYKYPIDDIIYTIDEMALQQSMDAAQAQVPSLISSFGTAKRNGYFAYETNIF